MPKRTIEKIQPSFVHTRHEIVGIVKKVGSNVGGFKAGDKVGVGTYMSTHVDRECVRNAMRG